jgi:uncharacterized protein
MDFENTVIAVLFFLCAALYAAVGHGGASGYIAVMALVDVDPSLIKSTALALNILVASVTTLTFYRVGAFSPGLFFPLIVTSIPCAYIGGLLTLPGYVYKPLIGVVLLYAAWQSFYKSKTPLELPTREITLFYLFIAGALLGFLSGISGVGGGIFLSPLLLFLRAAQPKIISGVAAAFILVNSIAGLLGAMSSGISLHPSLSYWAVVVVIGGYLGAEMGSKKFSNALILKTLALVLLVAGVKMLITTKLF